MIETLKKWLMTCPGWTGGMETDGLSPIPGNWGLFGKGGVEVSRNRDILGGLRCRNRYSFQLYGNLPQEESVSLWLLQLRQWAQNQNALGLTPVFGEDTVIEIRNGGLRDRKQPGCGIYLAEIIVEFTTKYEVK